MATFIRGYMIVLKGEQDTQVKDHMMLHLEDQMEDADVYSLDEVQANPRRLAEPTRAEQMCVVGC